MCAMQAQRREDSGLLHERVILASPRQSANAHPFSSIMASASSEGARTSSATTSAANLAALVPPSMRARTTNATAERRYSDLSDSSSSSRRRKRASALLPLAGKSSEDSVETGTGYRSQSPPRHSPSNLSPPRERRRKSSSLSDVSVSTAEEDLYTTPPAVSTTCNARPVRASDYAPLPDVVGAEGAGRASPTQPKLARPRFGHESVKVPQAPTGISTEAAGKADDAAFTGSTPQSSATTTATKTESVQSSLSPPPPLLTPAASTSPSTPVAVPLNAPVDPSITSTSNSATASATSSPHRTADSRVEENQEARHSLINPASETATGTGQKAPSEASQPPLPPPPLRHGGPPVTHETGAMPPMTNPPPIAPRNVHSASASDAEARADDTGFTPLPEIPREEPHRRHDRHPQSSRTATPEQPQANNRARSARRPTQSVQTARARAQQRRTAASSSPHARGTPVAPTADFFPGAKRLDDDRVPLSTKLVLGTACVVGVALVFYLGRSAYRYAAANMREPTPPVPVSKFARARMPKKAVVTDKEAAKIARDIRDRIVTNMRSAIQTGGEA